MGGSGNCVSDMTFGGFRMLKADTSNYLDSTVEIRSQPAPLKRHIFSADVAVQTDSVVIASHQSFNGSFERTSLDASEEEQISSLTAADLASILKWSKEISGDINLSMALQRLTEIATGLLTSISRRCRFITHVFFHSVEISVSQNTCVVIARDAGDYTVATSMNPPEPCKVHENPIPIRAISDPLRRTVIQHGRSQIYARPIALLLRYTCSSSHKRACLFRRHLERTSICKRSFA